MLNCWCHLKPFGCCNSSTWSSNQAPLKTSPSTQIRLDGIHTLPSHGYVFHLTNKMDWNCLRENKKVTTFRLLESSRSVFPPYSSKRLLKMLARWTVTYNMKISQNVHNYIWNCPCEKQQRQQQHYSKTHRCLIIIEEIKFIQARNYWRK